MLLSLAERTLECPLIHADLDSTSGEADERRQYARGLKAENTAWEGQKKKLNAAAVRAKTPFEGRQNQERIKQAQKEHELRVALLDVSLILVLADFR